MRRRHLLQAAALAAPCFSRHARAADVPRFGLGIASGNPHPGGMVLWTRLLGDDLPANVEVQWELAHDEAFSQIVARGSETASVEWAHSVHAEPATLAPERWYWYRFQALGQRSPAGRTRTAPAPGAVASLRAVTASCQRWDHGEYAAWRHVAASTPDLVLFLGDYIYEYPWIPGRVRAHSGGMVNTLSDYRARYAQYKADPALQAAHASCPWLMVWDDHEVQNDYAGLHGSALQSDLTQQRAAAYQAYWEHLPFPKAARPQGPDMRIDGRLDWGRLARIHLLDDRQYRDLQACPPLGHFTTRAVTPAGCPSLLDPRRTLLGPAQEQWLKEGWDHERPWNLLAQQTLMARQVTNQEGRVWTDGWDGYPAARQRLLDEVAALEVRGVVVLGGDVHAHYVADLPQRFDSAKPRVIATEFCGTSISSEGRSQAEIDALRPLNPHLLHGRSDQRGYIALTLDAKLLRADLMAVANARDAHSEVGTQASFVVEAGRPGAQSA